MKVLFLGNSITRHEPKPEIKWFHDFGMAASCKENDYVHQCVEMLSEKFEIQYMFRNIADWERAFLSFDYGTLNAEREFGCDVLVMRISENIDQNYARENDFARHYLRLIDYVSDAGAKKVLSTNFWGEGLDLYSDKVIRDIAREKGWPCAELGGFGADRANKAYPSGDFLPAYAEVKDVCEHPGDKGMKLIATEIARLITEECSLPPA